MRAAPCLLTVLVAISGFQTVAQAAEPAEAFVTPEQRAALPAGFIAEAPFPKDFPLPSEPGKIVEKTYPVLRSYSAKGDNAFFKCFLYLQQNKHEMTAPVVMDYPAGKRDSAAQRGEMPVPVDRMHFLLEDLSLDQPKQAGNIEVADMPPMRVLSIAFQGKLTPEKVGELESALAEELGRRPELKATGERRILGYNSPMVPDEKSYWELQIPVENAAALAD